MGFPFPSQSNGFDEVYLNVLGGRNNYYSPSALLTGKMLFEYNENISLGLLCEYYLVEMRDEYSQNIQVAGKNISRRFLERLDIQTLPIAFIAEYSPADTPYKNYVGLGAGFSIGNIKWFENVNSDIYGDRRHSSEIYNDSPISPFVKMYFGVLLNFDKRNKKEFLGALHFEVSINYLFRSLKIYEELNKQYVKPPEEFNRRYFVLPFYLGLSAGISFNLFHRIN